jgi:hypothetical protein
MAVVPAAAGYDDAELPIRSAGSSIICMNYATPCEMACMLCSSQGYFKSTQCV